MRILGIETSCDETAAAVIETGEGDKKVELISNVVASSLYLHSKTGGIIPEIAAREQVEYIIPVIKKAIENCKLKIENLEAIAVTFGPGLIGSLLVGVETAKTLSYVWQKPIIPVNHLIGHIYANWVTQEKVSKGLKVPKVSKGDSPSDTFDTFDTSSTPKFPCVALIVSGGHTDLVLMKKHRSIKWLGGTRDDAAGEAFDKIGRLLRLPYPGGPAIEKAAQNGNPKAFNFPRPMIDSNDFNFSFSGLKTAVLNLINKNRWKFNGSNPVILGIRQMTETPESLRTLHDKGDSGQARMTKIDNKLISDLSASVQQAIIDVLIAKTLNAAQKYKVESILLGGGVAANENLRKTFQSSIINLKSSIKFFAPAKNLCTDNAAMIASAAFFNYKPISWRKLTANPELYFN